MIRKISKRNFENIARKFELWKRGNFENVARKFENVARKIENVPRNFENFCQNKKLAWNINTKNRVRIGLK